MKKLAILTVVALFMAGTANAATIGVNLFNNWSDMKEKAGVLPTDTAGAVAQGNWNNYTQNNPTTGLSVWDETANEGAGGWVAKGSSTYIDSDGNDTTLSVSYSMSNPDKTKAFQSASYNPTNGDERLLSAAAPKVNGITLSNVPYDTYDLIVYVADKSDKSEDYVQSVTVGATTKYVNQANSYDDIHDESTATTEAAATEGTYVRFNGLSNTSDVTISVGPNWEDTVAGFQIVPEPATMVLLGLGGVGLLLKRRHRA